MQWSVLGHERMKNYFSKALKEGFSSHAYLLSGPDGIGKRAMALDVIRAAHAGAEPGVNDPFTVLIGPNEKGTISKKEHIEPLQRAVALRPPPNTRTFVVIDDAERLSFDAAHAVLKVLEEPPAHALFLLVTALPGQLFGTIRSRCLQMRFTPPSDNDVLTYLHERGAPAALREDLAAMAGGSIGWLERTLEQNGAEDAVAAFRTFTDMLGAGAAERLAWARHMADHADLRHRVLRWMYAIRTDMEREPMAARRVNGLIELYRALGQNNLNVRLAVEHFALTA